MARTRRPVVRGDLRQAVLAAAVVVLLLAPVAEAIPAGRDAIGDSVMLAAKEELRARGVRVNAVRSRQFRDAVSIVRSMASAGTLRAKVVIHLGTNGILIQGTDCDAISKAAGSLRRVFLMTVTGPTPSIRKIQNTRLRACAERRANTWILDWFGYSRGHPGWFTADGMHLTATGQRAYAAYVVNRT